MLVAISYSREKTEGERSGERQWGEIEGREEARERQREEIETGGEKIIFINSDHKGWVNGREAETGRQEAEGHLILEP